MQRFQPALPPVWAVAQPSWVKEPSSFLLHLHVAADAERLEDPFERDACLLADGAHVGLLAVEEAEDGLVCGHQDRAEEAQATAPPALSGRYMAPSAVS